MRKIDEITAKKVEKTETGKTANLWNSIQVESINTCDYIAHVNNLQKFNYGIVGNIIIRFLDDIKPSTVLGNDTTVDEVKSIEKSEFPDYGIVDIYFSSYNLQELPKPNGFGLYIDNDGDIVIIMTNGSTFKKTK